MDKSYVIIAVIGAFIIGFLAQTLISDRDEDVREERINASYYYPDDYLENRDGDIYNPLNKVYTAPKYHQLQRRDPYLRRNSRETPTATKPDNNRDYNEGNYLRPSHHMMFNPPAIKPDRYSGQPDYSSSPPPDYPNYKD